eukprot:346080_1
MSSWLSKPKPLELPKNTSFETLCSYLPASIVSYLSDADVLKHKPKPPFKHTWETVVLFADISGFTMLSENLASRGPSGAETLAKYLKSYFEQLVRIIASQGGDVFKFAGDALLVLWPKSDEDLVMKSRRAVQCAQEIQERLHGFPLDEGDGGGKKNNTLSIKVGIGIGVVSVMHVGGVLSRMEYIATGPPLIMAFNAESRAQPGDVVLSPAVWNLVKEYFKFSNDPFDPKEGGFAFLDLSKSKKMLTNVSVVVYTTHTNRRSRSYDLETLFKSVQNYIPSAVLPFLNDMEKWASELRKITCMFVNLGFSPEVMATEEEGHQEKIHEVMVAVNESIYNFEGSLNKFLMDDKGFTLIAVFGLRPLSH